MTLYNQHWRSPSGEPLTGKVPPRMIVYAPPGAVLSEQQWGQISHAYKLFCDAVTFSTFP